MNLHTSILGAALLLAFAGTAQAADYSVGSLRISHPWSRPIPPGAAAAIGYMRVTNTGKTDDVLKGGVSPEIARIEVHEMTFAGGIMRMRPVAGGLTIKPGQTVTLGPGGFHLMLIGPRRPLEVGAHIPATLMFAKAGALRLRFDVEQPAAGADMPHGAGR